MGNNCSLECTCGRSKMAAGEVGVCACVFACVGGGGGGGGTACAFPVTHAYRVREGEDELCQLDRPVRVVESVHSSGQKPRVS